MLNPFLDNLWRWKCGFPEEPTGREIDDLQRTEWSKTFEIFMRNRLVMGALRYGKLRDPRKPKFNRVGAIVRKLMLYQDDGNLEHLVDVANLALLEFEEGQHPKRHWAAADDRNHVTRV
jgi:hypothetical protein